MQDNQDAGDVWFQERFGRAPASGTTPRRQVLWYGGSLLVALTLLGSFYLVLNQAVARGQQHWAQTGQGQFAAKSEACGAGRSPEVCAAGRVEPAGPRSDSPGAMTAAGR